MFLYFHIFFDDQISIDQQFSYSSFRDNNFHEYKYKNNKKTFVIYDEREKTLSNQNSSSRHSSKPNKSIN